MFEYYKGLIAFRKSHGALRLSKAEDVAVYVTPVDGLDANVLAYDIKGGQENETADELFLVFNANESETTVTLPEGSWNVCINGEKAGTEVLETVSGGSLTVAPVSAMALVKESSQEAGSGEAADVEQAGEGVQETEDNSGGFNRTVLVIVIVAVVVCGGGFAVSRRKKKE